jgi:hypothetical protein
MSSVSFVRRGHAFFIIFFLLFILPVISYAGDVAFPVPSYSPEELAKVGEWEKTWVGKRIDKSNISQVAEFLPQSYAGIYKKPDTWGGPPDGLYFYIAPYRQVMPTQGEIEATKKYSPVVRTNAHGIIENHTDIAGTPFPAPKTGLEVAYNYEFNTHGDTSHYRRFAPNINPKSRTERISEQENSEFYFIHRTELDPRPALPDNPRGIHRGYFLNMYKPPEFLNTRYYTLRFIDPAKDDDTYLWYSQFRRIRRMSTTQRTDSLDGTDLIYDDEFFWDGHLERNTYTLQGTRDLLCSRHQDMTKTTRQAGQAVINGLTLERCKTYVLDVVNKEANYIYGKRVWYIDPESYIILWTDIYDQNGKFWKCFMQNTCPVKTEKGEMKHFIVGSQFNDFQRIHSGLSDQTVIAVSTEDIKPNMFSIGYLQKTY